MLYHKACYNLAHIFLNQRNSRQFGNSSRDNNRRRLIQNHSSGQLQANYKTGTQFLTVTYIFPSHTFHRSLNLQCLCIALLDTGYNSRRQVDCCFYSLRGIECTLAFLPDLLRILMGTLYILETQPDCTLPRSSSCIRRTLRD